MLNEHEQVTEISEKLAVIIERWTTGVQQKDTEIEGLHFYRQDNVSGCSNCIVEPSIALVVQGEKSMIQGDTIYRYDAHHFLITSLDLPAVMQVLNASPDKPYLGLSLKLDLRLIGELMLQAPDKVSSDVASEFSMVLGHTTPVLLDAILRLVSLLDDPDSISVLAPLIIREIYWRVLMSEQGGRLRQIVSVGSHGNRISRTVEWLKSNYDQPLKIEELANIAKMSVSTFHHHFRQITAMSPLQYQKWLRLNEARRLMLGESLDAAKAAYSVGYESPSQFSREYARMFGAPPKRDIKIQRAHVMR